MIKEEHQGKTYTIKGNGFKRTIEVFDGMPLGDIAFLKSHNIDVLEEVKKEKKMKPKKYEAIEHDENTDEEINENGEA